MFFAQEVESHRVSENCDKLSLALKQHEAEIKRRDEEINEMQSKVTTTTTTVSTTKFIIITTKQQQHQQQYQHLQL